MTDRSHGPARRRRLVIAALVIAGCSTSETGSVTPDGRPPTPSEWDRAVVRPVDGQAAAQRAACTFHRGAMPAETLGASAPLGEDIPIDTVVILMQENRSFDHYFAELPRFARRNDIEVPPAGASNPDLQG